MPIQLYAALLSTSVALFAEPAEQPVPVALATPCELSPELTEEQDAMLRHLAQMAREGQPLPALCLAPDTPAKVADQFNAFFEGVQGGEDRYLVQGRWPSTALSGGGLTLGQPTVITYSFVPDGTQVPNLQGLYRSSNLFATLDAHYGSTAAWQALFAQVFARWSEVTGLSYVYEPNDDGVNIDGTASSPGVAGVRGDVRISGVRLDGGSGVLAFNFFPDAGDMVIDTADFSGVFGFFVSTANNSFNLRQTVAHEHGHGIGAAHTCPLDNTKLMEPYINTNFDGPQIDDILYGQRAYGDALEDNDSLATATPLGSVVPNDSASYPQISIDGAQDVDYFSFSTASSIKVTVTLTPAAGSYLMGPQSGNGQCTAGVQTNYQSKQNLRVEFFDDQGGSLGVFNTSPAGVVETATIELPSGGDYAFAVQGSGADEIQLYDLDVAFEPGTSQPCPADMNGDGFLDNGDISAFIALFLGGNLVADFNSDGFLDNGDIASFVAAFLAGC